MYELKEILERYLRVNLLGPGPRLMKKNIYRAAVHWYRRLCGPRRTIKAITYPRATSVADNTASQFHQACVA